MPKPVAYLRSRSLNALLLSYAFRAALERARPRRKPIQLALKFARSKEIDCEGRMDWGGEQASATIANWIEAHANHASE